MRTVHSPRLLPVVEIPPWRYLNHISPPEGRLDDDDWNNYWRESVAASGFTAIEPIFPGSMFVPIEQITSSGSLDAIINYELGQLDVEDGDLPCALEGGYFLYDDGKRLRILSVAPVLGTYRIGSSLSKLQNLARTSGSASAIPASPYRLRETVSSFGLTVQKRYISTRLCAGRAHFEQRFLVWNNKS